MDFFPYTLAPWQWAAAAISCVCFGISKTGLNGISIAAVPLFALVFGGKESTGVVLPLICFADLFAVIYYRRHAEWKYIWRLIPWALAGFALALGADHFISSNRGFKILIGICIAAGFVVMIWNEGRNRRQAGSGGAKPPSGWWFSAVFGIMGGFSTMIGNAAGPIMSVFLLSVRLPKESFVGTAAWFFLIVNYLKIPLQTLVWHNISIKTLLFDVTMIPCLLLGVWLGILFVKKVTEKQYRIAVYALTIISAGLLFL
ncbi:anion permease [Spirochaetia bacterium]|nr:anion permease [Spirochaetia bacterium]